MKKKRGHIIFLMLILFLTTSGITVFQHYCQMQKDKHSFSFMTKEMDCCESEVDVPMEMEDDQACCKAISSDEASKKMSAICCETESNVLKIQMGLNFLDFQSNVTFTQFPYHYLGFSMHEKRKTAFTNKSPPLTTSQRLSQKQSYIL